MQGIHLDSREAAMAGVIKDLQAGDRVKATLFDGAELVGVLWQGERENALCLGSNKWGGPFLTLFPETADKGWDLPWDQIATIERLQP